MAITNHERVGKALDLLKAGLKPYVERELRAINGQRWLDEAGAAFRDGKLPLEKGGQVNWDSTCPANRGVEFVEFGLWQEAGQFGAHTGQRAAHRPQRYNKKSSLRAESNDNSIIQTHSSTECLFIF